MRKFKLRLLYFLLPYFFLSELSAQFPYHKLTQQHCFINSIGQLPNDSGFIFAYGTTKGSAITDSTSSNVHLLFFNRHGVFLRDTVIDSTIRIGTKLHPYKNRTFCGIYKSMLVNGHWKDIAGVAELDVLGTKFLKWKWLGVDSLNGTLFAFHNDKILYTNHKGSDSTQLSVLDSNLTIVQHKILKGRVWSTIYSNYTPQLLGSGLIPNTNKIYQLVMLDNSLNFYRTKVIDSLGLDSFSFLGQVVNANMMSMDSRLVEHDTSKTILSFSNRFCDKFPCSVNKFNKVVTVILEQNEVKRISRIGDSQVASEVFATKILGNILFHVAYAKPTNYLSSLPGNEETKLLVIREDILSTKLDTFYYSEPGTWLYPTSIEITADTSIIITGGRYNMINPKVDDQVEGFILHFNRSGHQLYTGQFAQRKDLDRFAFPNPVNNHTLFLKNVQIGSQLRLLTMEGKVLMQGSLDQSQTTVLNFETIPNGVYLLEINFQNTRHVEKVIVIRPD